MASIWINLRTGAWLTAIRIRGYSIIVLAIAVSAILGWIATSSSMIDLNKKPIGTDFSSFYAAGSLALEGKAAAAYDIAAHHARQEKNFGNATPHYVWLYPPPFLLIATPLALLPYAAALALWQGLTLVLYLVAIGAIVKRSGIVLSPRDWILPALAFPAVLINLGHGQNGFLTASLFAAALLNLPIRPIVAGVLFGLLSYKPQFALMIPLALLAARQWKTMTAATVTVLALILLTVVMFGPDTWHAFFASTTTARELLLEQGSVGFEKLQSAFAALRSWEAEIPLAYACQTAVTVLVGAAIVWLWRGPHDYALKAGALLVGTLLASPHVLDYDLVLLGPALTFLSLYMMKTGIRDFEATALAGCWIAPLIARTVADLTDIPLGLMAMTLAFEIVIWRAVTNTATHSRAGVMVRAGSNTS